MSWGSFALGFLAGLAALPVLLGGYVFLPLPKRIERRLDQLFSEYS